jgi:hypothetical protein
LATVTVCTARTGSGAGAVLEHAATASAIPTTIVDLKARAVIRFRAVGMLADMSFLVLLQRVASASAATGLIND